MEIVVKRIAKRDKYTIGKLSIDGEYICDTIEDRDRGLTSDMSLEQIKKIKVPSQTAIPTGKYKITLKIQSPTFSKKIYYKLFCDGYLPRIQNVPGYEGVLIHRGVDENSSAGCIIVGYNKVVGKVLDSQKAFEAIYKKLKSAKDQIYITIK